MGTTITLSAGTLPPVVITGDAPFVGPTYDRLDGWYGTPDVDLGFVSRPNAFGAFAPTQSYPNEAKISIEGSYFGPDRQTSLRMRETLTALYNGGRPVRMTVTDDLRTTYRDVFVSRVRLPWSIHPDFAYAIDMSAADPRRYMDAGAPVSTELESPGSGLRLPSTSYDWLGTANQSATAQVENGVETRRNIALPLYSFGWQPFTGTTTIGSGVVTFSADSAQQAVFGRNEQALAVLPNTKYTASVDVQVDTGSGTFRVQINYMDANRANAVEPVGTDFTVSAGERKRIFFTSTSAAASAYARVTIIKVAGTSPTGSWSNPLLEQSDQNRPFFDGNTPNIGLLLPSNEAAGLGIDFGTTGTDGRVIVTNEGNTETVSVYTVSADLNSSMPDGFTIVNVATGERLQYLGPVTAGTSVVLDTRTRTAFINGTAPAGRFVASPQWWSVPPRSSLQIAFLARGSVTGRPKLEVSTPSAFL